eukprot:4784813-Pleurochrysis_carterae.AAC.1
MSATNAQQTINPTIELTVIGMSKSAELLPCRTDEDAVCTPGMDGAGGMGGSKGGLGGGDGG